MLHTKISEKLTPADIGKAAKFDLKINTTEAKSRPGLH